jgi:DNA primase
VRDGKPMDNYRGRIIFPVHNQSGKVLGFGARILKTNDRAPKYINTPENEIYVKSKLLYGSYFARMAIDKADECLLVEGYTDVVSLHQAGIENVVASGGTSLTPDQLRLVKKYTDNLTIIYDGDSAGIKAALRGMDLAFEAGLNVKLVLIPDKEDPDSYVNKIGSAAFKEFITANKKDFILFQLEVSLKDAANDSTKKSALVNQVAETISKINKAEDFTKQQDYIKQCAELLKIEEGGLHALVNKFIRDKISKEENRVNRQDADDAFNQAQALDTDYGIEEDAIELLNKQEQHERALVRILLEYGLKPWNDEQTLADHAFKEIESNGLEELFDNKGLTKIISNYKELYQQGKEPTLKSFLYSEGFVINSLDVKILDNNEELSINWDRVFEGKIIRPEDLYKEEFSSILNYLKLRKIKRMMDENQLDLEKSHTIPEQIELLQVHQHLKQMEMELTDKIGTVIFR